MDGIIRKITIGPDIKQGMTYSIGQVIGDIKITDVIGEEDGSWVIYGFKNETKFKWKYMNPYVPVTIEYSLKY